MRLFKVKMRIYEKHLDFIGLQLLFIASANWSDAIKTELRH